MSIYALEIENLNFSFSNQHESFFSHLCFSLEKGKIHALKGKNGSGKSTLFSILQGEINKESYLKGNLKLGEKEYLLQNSQPLSSILKQSIALMNQRYDSMIADQFSFEDNLKFASFSLFPHFLKKPKTSRPLPAFVEKFGIDLQKPLHLLSGGQRQILALLMILQKSPSILLLDEPTATLDPINVELVGHFLTDLAKIEGLTILLICHDTDFIQHYCNGSIFEFKMGHKGERILEKSS
jgi:ABC-type multidrug transport system ATPase subunit